MDENNVENSVVGREEEEEEVVIEMQRVSVKRRIGLIEAIALVVGSMIGSGIFISPKGALKNSGSVGMSLVIWAVCGLLSMILALVYAELGVLLPKSGGNYAVIKHGIGDVPAFLVSWVQCIVTDCGSRTIMALAFADYVCAPLFSDCATPNSVRKSIAALELMLLAITNAISVKLVSSMQGIFTLLKLSALIVIIIGGIIYLFKGQTEHFDGAFEGTTKDVTSISIAVYNCMWAYSGYQSLNEIAEEVIDPKKNIPRALLISLLTVTFVYISTNVSYYVLLSKAEFLSVPAVAFTWGNMVLGGAAIYIPICVMGSIHGASNGLFFTDARVRFACARAGHLPEVLSFLHHKSRIPVAAVILNITLSLIYLIPGDIAELLNLTSFVNFLIQLLATIACLRLRYQKRNCKEESEFRVPLFVLFLAIAICLFMLISPFISNPKIEFLYAIGFIFSGLLFYIPFVHFGLRIPGSDCITLLSQLVLDICPTVKEEDLHF